MFTTQSLSQRDPRWSSQQLGFGDADSTIGNYGCTLVGITMLANGFGFDETPASLNNKLKGLGNGVGYAGATRNLFVFSALDATLPGMKYLDRVWCDQIPAPMDRINAELDASRGVIVQLDQSPAPSFQQHWVLVYAREGGDYLIRDPWLWPTQGRVTITRDYGFSGTVEKIITHCVFYDGPHQAPIPVGPLTVVVNDDPDIAEVGGLALRDQPALGGALIKRIPANTELALEESEADAQAKIGIPGQWIHVATNGNTGFVAAWLVHAKGADVRAISAQAERAIDAPPEVQPVWNAIALVVNRPKRAPGVKNPPSPILRSKPSTGKAIAELRPNTPLDFREPLKTALKKVGVRGKWIKVRDNKGRIGYVSAQYVHVRTSHASQKRTIKG